MSIIIYGESNTVSNKSPTRPSLRDTF